ncbi:MAG: LysR substrate-binding domain-containing protein [Silicimonas sp.]|uniref:LysR family transcriptional regulator n=1 Tax=Roseobacteraceae TaxID=2854170 RepID=UPI000DF26002|nr:LysR family transcriptional regulator [Sulfitobacter sp. DFL-23]
MSFDLKTLELYVRVATVGAIARAGLEFGFSATTSSQRIQALEAQIGCKLLNRTTRSVSLSADGELFLAHAKKILADVDDAITDMQGSETSLRGELRVAASASFGRRYIAPHIGEFLRLHPDVSINLELSDTTFDIVQHGFDLAIRIGALAPSTLMARKIADNPRILVASADYLKVSGTPMSPAELSNHNCIVLNENRIWGLRGSDGTTTEVRTQGNFTTSYGEALTEAASAGAGIALKSKWDVLEQLIDGTLVPVLPRFAVEPEWSVWAVRPPGRLMSARVRVFTEFIENKLATALVQSSAAI